MRECGRVYAYSSMDLSKVEMDLDLRIFPYKAHCTPAKPIPNK